MNSEKLRILQMIKDGALSPEEGLDLIDALDSSATPMISSLSGKAPQALPQGEPSDEADDETPPAKKPRWLHIQVHDGEDNKNVNIKIPISLARFAGKFIPNDAKKEMKEQGIDLDLEGLMDMLEKEGRQDLVEVNEGEGKTVRIFTR